MFAVLMSLLFSYGEGVRLLPFPVINSAENANQNIDGKNKIPYQFSIHRFENIQGKTHSKSQSNGQNHHWTKDDILPDYLHFNVFINWRESNFPPSLYFLRSNFFLASQSGRAPPVS